MALVEVISVTPAISPSRRSSGAAMEVAIVSGSAPGRPAKTTMVGMSTLGSGATGKKRYATAPAISRPSASKIVAIGRMMKGLEKPVPAMARPARYSAGAGRVRTSRSRRRSNVR